MARNLYPLNHEVAIARVLRVFDIIVARPEISDDEIVAALVSEGVDQVDAVLLVYLVPWALSYSVLKRVGVSSFFLFYIVNTHSGRVVHLPLEQEHYFTAASEWAEQLLSMEPAARPVSLEEFNTLASRSPAMDAANKLRESGGPGALLGAALGPLCIGSATITAEQIWAARSRGKPNRPWWKFWR